MQNELPAACWLKVDAVLTEIFHVFIYDVDAAERAHTTVKKLLVSNLLRIAAKCTMRAVGWAVPALLC